MNPVLSTLVLLAGLTEASTGTARQASYRVATKPEAPTAVVVAEQPQLMPGTVVTSGESFIGDFLLPEQAQANVLVVPTPDLPAESLADLTEDLAVMCRIFDKAVGPSRASVGSLGVGGYGTFRYVAGQQPAQGLYLDGYGALFFIDVDYPLVPPPQDEPAQAKTQEPVDSVWSQTIEEMSGRQEGKADAARAAGSYDPQKVENLKKALIKTLAHASNIRARRPQDLITVVVGRLDDDKVYGYRRSTGSRSDLLPSLTNRAAAGRPSSRAGVGRMSAAAALLVMRITKAEVDALAKGQLTQAQFAEKVQVLWSRPSLSEPQGQPAAPTAAPATRR